MGGGEGIGYYTTHRVGGMSLPVPALAFWPPLWISTKINWTNDGWNVLQNDWHQRTCGVCASSGRPDAAAAAAVDDCCCDLLPTEKPPTWNLCWGVGQLSASDDWTSAPITRNNQYTTLHWLTQFTFNVDTRHKGGHIGDHLPSRCIG